MVKKVARESFILFLLQIIDIICFNWCFNECTYTSYDSNLNDLNLKGFHRL